MLILCRVLFATFACGASCPGACRASFVCCGRVGRAVLCWCPGRSLVITWCRWAGALVPCLIMSCCRRRAVLCGCCGWCRMRFYCEGARLSGCARLPVPVLCWCVPHCPVPCAVLIMWATSCPVLCSSFSSVVACRTMCRVAVVKCSCPLSSHAVLSSALVLFLCAVLSSCCRASLLYPYLDLGAVSSCLTHPARSGSDPIIDTFQLRERSKIRRNTNPAE